MQRIRRHHSRRDTPITAPAAIWQSIVDFTLNQPGGLGGTVGLVLFVVVAIVSESATRGAVVPVVGATITSQAAKMPSVERAKARAASREAA